MDVQKAIPKLYTEDTGHRHNTKKLALSFEWMIMLEKFLSIENMQRSRKSGMWSLLLQSFWIQDSPFRFNDDMMTIILAGL